MKKLLYCTFLVLYTAFGTGFAQYAAGQMGYAGTEGGMLYGGLGVTMIDDETYFSISFRPEVAFGKLGVGLNINLLYNMESGGIRSKDWDSSYDYFRLIRYIRWGHKWDPVYARVGTLDAARLGHGFIVNYYTNEASYDERKIGLAFDVDMGNFGFETVTSNLGRAELIGGRAYYRPLYGMEIPIIKNFAVGASFARDFDPDVWSNSDDGVSVYGFDVELPVIKSQIFNTTLYADWAQIQGYSAIEDESRTFGSGEAVGIMASLGNLANMIDISAKLERRWLGKEFAASFFDPFYELQRYQVMSGDTLVKGFRKVDMLINAEETAGVFGELYGSLLGDKVRLLGMFTRLDDRKESGIMHIGADAPDAIPGVAAHAMYDKFGIETLGDAFSIDDRSIARVGLGYKIKPYLIIYMDYIWTYVETEPGSREYKTQERVEPKLVFSYQF
ncbi:hypothetical protein EH223_07145 [candidate division KSB1 bacterium]|nr:MAG: hypothetical protein EH223_07145 [candidate division KSB1 bacterium]